MEVVGYRGVSVFVCEKLFPKMHSTPYHRQCIPILRSGTYCAFENSSSYISIYVAFFTGRVTEWGAVTGFDCRGRWRASYIIDEWSVAIEQWSEKER